MQKLSKPGFGFCTFLLNLADFKLRERWPVPALSTAIRGPECVPFLSLSPVCPGTGRVSRGIRLLVAKHQPQEKSNTFDQPLAKSCPVQTTREHHSDKLPGGAWAQVWWDPLEAQLSLKAKTKDDAGVGDSLILCSGFQCEDEPGWGVDMSTVNDWWCACSSWSAGTAGGAQGFWSRCFRPKELQKNVLYGQASSF